jgi:hypothetical protein
MVVSASARGDSLTSRRLKSEDTTTEEEMAQMILATGVIIMLIGTIALLTESRYPSVRGRYLTSNFSFKKSSFKKRSLNSTLNR